MFTLTNMPPRHSNNTSGFITTEARGYLSDQPEVEFHQIRFAPEHYHDALFNQWEIPFPEHINTAVNKRKAEYLAGRYCAKQRLEALGIHAFEVRRGDDLAPIWPPAIIGSISHHHRSAIVVTSLAQMTTWLGIDTELIMSMDVARNLREMIVDEQEFLLLTGSGIPLNQAITLAFSLKESLYKALYPLVNKFFDCHAARIITLSPQQGKCQLQLTQSLNEIHSAGKTYRGRFMLSEQEVTTLVTKAVERSQHPSILKYDEYTRYQ